MNPVFEKFGHLPVWAISYTTAMGRGYSSPLTPYLPNDKGILNTVVGDTKGITLAECHDWITKQRDSVRSRFVVGMFLSDSLGLTVFHIDGSRFGDLLPVLATYSEMHPNQESAQAFVLGGLKSGNIEPQGGDVWAISRDRFVIVTSTPVIVNNAPLPFADLAIVDAEQMAEKLIGARAVDATQAIPASDDTKVIAQIPAWARDLMSTPITQQGQVVGNRSYDNQYRADYALIAQLITSSGNVDQVARIFANSPSFLTREKKGDATRIVKKVLQNLGANEDRAVENFQNAMNSAVDHEIDAEELFTVPGGMKEYGLIEDIAGTPFHDFVNTMMHEVKGRTTPRYSYALGTSLACAAGCLGWTYGVDSSGNNDPTDLDGLNVNCFLVGQTGAGKGTGEEIVKKLSGYLERMRGREDGPSFPIVQNTPTSMANLAHVVAENPSMVLFMQDDGKPFRAAAEGGAWNQGPLEGIKSLFSGGMSYRSNGQLSNAGKAMFPDHATVSMLADIQPHLYTGFISAIDMRDGGVVSRCLPFFEDAPGSDDLDRAPEPIDKRRLMSYVTQLWTHYQGSVQWKDGGIDGEGKRVKPTLIIPKEMKPITFSAEARDLLNAAYSRINAFRANRLNSDMVGKGTSSVYHRAPIIASRIAAIVTAFNHVTGDVEHTTEIDYRTMRWALSLVDELYTRARELLSSVARSSNANIASQFVSEIDFRINVYPEGNVDHDGRPASPGCITDAALRDIFNSTTLGETKGNSLTRDNQLIQILINQGVLIRSPARGEYAFKRVQFPLIRKIDLI